MTKTIGVNIHKIVLCLMFLALFLFTMVEFAAIAKDTTQTSEYAVLEYDKHLHII